MTRIGRVKLRCAPDSEYLNPIVREGGQSVAALFQIESYDGLVSSYRRVA